jgi:transcription initiation factor TFIIIB Brf1 subunit/transcription initiation factor TFIIB
MSKKNSFFIRRSKDIEVKIPTIIRINNDENNFKEYKSLCNELQTPTLINSKLISHNLSFNSKDYKNIKTKNVSEIKQIPNIIISSKYLQEEKKDDDSDDSGFLYSSNDNTAQSSPVNINKLKFKEDIRESSIENVLIDDEEPENIIYTDDIDFSASDDLCSHNNVIKEKNITICEDCGIELYEEISREQDWRYFGDSDSRSNSDPSRVQYRKSPEKGIKKDLDRLGFPPDICELADKLYMTVTQGEVKRSELRRGIMFAVVFEAYKMKGNAKTPEELQKKFGLERKSMSQGITYYKMRIPREYFNYEDITAKHFIPSIMKKLNVKEEHVQKVCLLYDKLKDVCIINRSNPQSSSKSLVYYYLRRKKCNISAIRYGRIVSLSDVIILRIASEISRVLGTQKTVVLN